VSGATFPSQRWLEAARARVNEDPAFRKLGSIDADVGIRAGKDVFLVRFEAFACTEARRTDPETLVDADYVLEMAPKEWKRYLAERREGRGPTLTELDLAHGVVKAHDARKRIEFLRHHLSVQAFLDAGAAAGR